MTAALIVLLALAVGGLRRSKYRPPWDLAGPARVMRRAGGVHRRTRRDANV
jgi:3'-phosphoadenosine 5'-phosphosulfate (PAPS) 3'-phosphatase